MPAAMDPDRPTGAREAAALAVGHRSVEDRVEVNACCIEA
jgi:hypothetical protein